MLSPLNVLDAGPSQQTATTLTASVAGDDHSPLTFSSSELPQQLRTTASSTNYRKVEMFVTEKNRCHIRLEGLYNRLIMLSLRHTGELTTLQQFR